MTHLCPGLRIILPKSYKLGDCPSDLPGLNTVYDWVEHGWHKEVDVGHEKVHSRWSMFPKAVHQRQPCHGHKEHEHSTEV